MCAAPGSVLLPNLGVPQATQLINNTASKSAGIEQLDFVSVQAALKTLNAWVTFAESLTWHMVQEAQLFAAVLWCVTQRVDVAMCTDILIEVFMLPGVECAPSTPLHVLFRGAKGTRRGRGRDAWEGEGGQGKGRAPC